MINESFKYFWRRTVSGGIWWENKGNALGEWAYLTLIPMMVLPFFFTKMSDSHWDSAWHQAYLHMPWYISYLASVAIYAASSFACSLVLYLVLKAVGFALMVWRYRSFIKVAELEWQLALTDHTRPAPLNKDEWLLDRIDHLAKTRYDLWLKRKFNCA